MVESLAAESEWASVLAGHRDGHWIWRATSSETQMPPGSASGSIRAAMLSPSPCTPPRDRPRRLGAGRSAPGSCGRRARWHATTDPLPSSRSSTPTREPRGRTHSTASLRMSRGQDVPGRGARAIRRACPRTGSRAAAGRGPHAPVRSAAPGGRGSALRPGVLDPRQHPHTAPALGHRRGRRYRRHGVSIGPPPVGGHRDSTLRYRC